MPLQRSARFLVAAVAVLALSVLLRNFNFPIILRVALGALAVFAALRPGDALLAAAAAGPFASVLAELLGSPPFRGYEAVMLAFLAGWLVHAPPPVRGHASRRVGPPALLLIAVLAASVITLALQLRPADPVFFENTIAALRDTYLWTADMIGVIEGANIVIGILILLAVVELTEHEPGRVFALIKVLAIAAAVATGLSVLLALGVGVPSALERKLALRGVRYSATIADVNAAGSYFVLLLGIAGGMAASSVGGRRRWWIAAVIVLLAGLGLSGSRSALAAALAVVMASAIWLLTGRGWRPFAALPRAGWAIALLLGMMSVVIFVRVPLSFGPDLRREFTLASFRLIEARPFFGIGIGRYYTLSRMALSPWLGAVYGEEHAHDYFLQIFAELGLAGFSALCWLGFAALRPALSALRDRSRDYVTPGLLAGVFGYLITCLSGHPLLISESGFPFWMVLGLACASGSFGSVRLQADPPDSGSVRLQADPRDSGSVRLQADPRSPDRSRLPAFAAALAAAVVFASVPFRLEPVQVKLRASEEDGFGPWNIERDGTPYRESAEYSALFVAPDVTSVEIPVRRLPGHEGHQLAAYDQESIVSRSRTIVTDSWEPIRITLPGAEPLMPYQRINLTVYYDNDERPGDRRASGLAVGEVKVIATRR